ncbi:hypothetical protein P3X46_015571 [Hevea brasiliensis]|uniref:Protein kinase domain-containing protein n=1 Tax=Hevea brasiliensis TaxID=3981 RepID=A0ABQ9LWC8_HEVBR|nr:hypothetical protein P3X46_015571 [Hevea brasiliensis]
MEAQRVVVIQDASREVGSSAVRWALQGLSLKPGDILTLLSILHQVDTHSKSSYAGSKNLLGYKSTVDSSSLFGANEKIVDRELTRKKDEYEKNAELIQISKQYETQKVEFRIEVATGPSPKVVALKAAEDLNATWVILDRHMKKDRKYFLMKLSCGISRMKRNNRIEQLRGPKTMKTSKSVKAKPHNKLLSYDEMVPGSPDDLFSIEIPPSVTEADQENLVQGMAQGSSTEEPKEELQAKEILHNSICALCKNRRPNFGWQRDFIYAELYAATNGFSAQNSLSEGGIGSAFRGQLKSNNMKIVVKQHKNACLQEEKDFLSEVHLLMKARHKNVLMLLGSCVEGSLTLLVYEYACNGSVYHHLSKHCPLPLTWAERMKVALGAARGLNYLHEKGIVHRNVRTSNIVLTHDFEPRLGDFGFSWEHNVLETLGYIAPEYLGNCKLSLETDVYAFGVVLLELITGRMVTDKIPGGKSLVGWASPLLKERRLPEMVDPRISNSHDAKQLYWMGRVAQNCLSKIPKKRLTMDRVVSALECIADKQAWQVMEDLSAVKSYLIRTMSDINTNREIYVENQISTSFSLTSSSARMSAIFSMSSSSSGKSDKLQHRVKPRNKNSVFYAEMHN